MSPTRRLSDEDGLISLELIFGLIFFMGVIVFAWNLAYFVYVQGAVRAAAVEGAHAGSLVERSVGECQKVAGDALTGLVGNVNGRIGVRCFDNGDTMVAVVTGSVRPWIDALPTVPVSAEIVVAKELDL